MIQKIETESANGNRVDKENRSSSNFQDSNRLKFWHLISAVAIFCFYWAFISAEKFLHFQATIFDLGVSMQSLWNITHISWTMGLLLYQFDYQGIAFILAPLQYLGYIPLLAFQSITIGLGSIAIFYISSSRGISYRNSLLIGLAYLFYFPLSSLNWFDFHFQSLFVTFFLFAYLCYLKNKYWCSSILFLVSGIVRFPYAIFPFLFWILAFVLDRKEKANVKFTWIAILNIILYTAILGSSYLLLKNGAISTHATSTIDPFYNLPVKLITIGVIFAPVLFIPLTSKRWMTLMLPYLILMFFANNPIYEFPYLFELQYPASFIAFVFLGLIDMMSSPDKFRHILNRVKTYHTYRKKNSESRDLESFNFHKMAVALLAACICSTAIFQATGPINLLNKEGINLASVTHYNQELTEFNSISSLIPRNCPYVLLQNNLPQFLPGPSGNNLRMPGFIGPNLSFSQFSNNSFPWKYGSFSAFTPIDYVLGDVASTQQFTQSLVDGFPSMANLSEQFLASGYYGILGEVGPFFVLERGYTGFPLMYSPYSSAINGILLSSVPNSIYYSIANITNYSGSVLLYSQFSLNPGAYKVLLNNNFLNFSSVWVGGIGLGFSSSMPKIFFLSRENLSLGTNTLANFTIHKYFAKIYIFIQFSQNIGSTRIPEIQISQTASCYT